MAAFNPDTAIHFNVCETTDYDCDGVSVGYHKIPVSCRTIGEAQAHMSAEHPYAGYSVTRVMTKDQFKSEFVPGMSRFSRDHWNRAGYYNPYFDTPAEDRAF